MGQMGLGVYVQSLGDAFSPPLPIELGYEVQGGFPRVGILPTVSNKYRSINKAQNRTNAKKSTHKNEKNK